MDLFTTAFLSGLFAALVAIAVTRAIEYFGGSVGGVIATLPTTIIPASIGIVLRIEGDNDKLSRAMFTVPVGMLVSAIFLYQWRYWPKRLNPSYSFRTRLIMMISISLGIWLSLAILVVAVEMYVFSTVQSIITFGSIAYVCIGIAGILACFRPLDAPAGTNRVGWKILLLRGLFSGIAIFITVSISSLNSIAAGIGSAFPAIFLTIMVSLWVSQGDAVTTGAVGPMMLGGMSPPCYAMLFATMYPTVGLIGSIFLSWIGAVVCISIPAAYFIKWRRNVTNKTSNGIENTHSSTAHKPSNDDGNDDDEDNDDKQLTKRSTTITTREEKDELDNERIALRKSTVLQDSRLTIEIEPTTTLRSHRTLEPEKVEEEEKVVKEEEEENVHLRGMNSDGRNNHSPVYVSEEGRGII